jgi:hypothetical protein
MIAHLAIYLITFIFVFPKEDMSVHRRPTPIQDNEEENAIKIKSLLCSFSFILLLTLTIICCAILNCIVERRREHNRYMKGRSQ